MQKVWKSLVPGTPRAYSPMGASLEILCLLLMCFDSGFSTWASRFFLQKIGSPWVAAWTSCEVSKVMELPLIGHIVRSGSHGLSVAGWFVPHGITLLASVLLFHGIDGRGFYWRQAQEVLAEAGISSLVFDIPGYGGNRSTATPGSMEHSARAACLKRFFRMTIPIG